MALTLVVTLQFDLWLRKTTKAAKNGIGGKFTNISSFYARILLYIVLNNVKVQCKF